MQVDLKQAKAIFLRAVQCRDSTQLRRLLGEACGDDATLRQHVDLLLDAHREAGSFLEHGAFDETPTQALEASEAIGSQLGPYKLLQQIGHGGMGLVYLAEQAEPVRRSVALKLIKPGMDSRQILNRFEAERQAMSLMDHPHIAKVLDAGVTAAGRPYFVMELVKGQPITQYCDERQLSPRERLQLFLPVCQALQHAHQKGVIHRDIKPSNILVAEYDHQPVPKVIDFGVAKALHQPLTEKTVFTALGQIIGTLEYMSPEQAKLNQLDVDTRSDVYALGVLLYELLTGTTPLDRERLRAAAWDEMLRIIREEEPPPPSTRLSSVASKSNATASSIAAARQSDPARLANLVRGELDWIVLKALDKERNRRYESAAAFAADVQHYLNDEPVAACPPSAVYRLRKFARRHRLGVAAGLSVGVSLVGGMIGTSWQMRAAQGERDRAVAAEGMAMDSALRADREARRAALEANRANQQAAAARNASEVTTGVIEFLIHDLLEQASPLHQPDPDLRLRDVAKRAAEKIDGRFPDQPLVEAAVLNTLARIDQSLGDARSAKRSIQRSWEIRRRELGAEHPETLATRSALAVACRELGQFDEAESILRETLEAQQRILGVAHPSALATRKLGAIVAGEQGHHAEAESLLRELLPVFKRAAAARDVLDVKLELANQQFRQGHFAAAESQFREAANDSKELLGEEHPVTLTCRNNLAAALSEQQEFGPAEDLFRETLAKRRQTLGEAHPDTVESLVGLALALKRQQRFEAAESLYETALAALKKLRTADHPKVLDVQFNLAMLKGAQGDYESALSLFQATFAAERDQFGLEHPRTRQTRAKLLTTYKLRIWTMVAADDPAPALLAQAAQAARAAMAIAGDHAELNGMLGVALGLSGDFTAAREAFLKAAKLSGQIDPRFGYVQSWVECELDMRADAERTYATTAQLWADRPLPDEQARFRALAERRLNLDASSRAQFLRERAADWK